MVVVATLAATTASGTDAKMTLAPNQIASSLRRQHFDDEVFAFNVASFSQSLSKRVQQRLIQLAHWRGENADHRLRRLLRMRSERPCHCRATKERHELPPPHGLPPLLREL
jgi:hypothetical protein